MSKPTRIKLLDEAPIRPPVLATKLWGITAACMIIGFFPVTAAMFYLWWKVAPWLRASFGVSTDPPVFLLTLASFAICYVIPVTIGFSAASLYTLRLVKYYLDHDEPEKADKVAEAMATKVWGWHARRRKWFREFVVDRGLDKRVPRYAKLRK